MDVPPLMVCTPGVTRKRFTLEPLGSEGEMTPGPDDSNPFRSAEEREIVEAYRAKEAEQKARGVDTNDTITLPFDDVNPTSGDDPFAFDDVDPLQMSGPRF